MRKIILVLIIIFIGLSIVSCFDKSINTGNLSISENTDINDFSNQNNVIEDDQFQEGSTKVPYTILFSSVEEIKKFINVANGTDIQYREYAVQNNINLQITQDISKKIVSNIENHAFPSVKFNENVVDFAATYYLDRNEFDVIYKIEEVRYRFIYKYDETQNEYKMSTSPIRENFQLDAYSVDMFQGDDCLIGFIVDKSVVVQIVIYSDRVDEIDFNVFSMKSLIS